MSSGYWVVLGSANGSSNLGDEAMWIAAAQMVRSLDPNAEVITDGPPSFRSPIQGVRVVGHMYPELLRGRGLPGLLGKLVSQPNKLGYARTRADELSSVPQGMAARWFDLISGSKGLIVSGAGAICDDYAFHGVYNWGVLVEYARKAGIPVLFLGQGVGPLQDLQTRADAGAMLAKAEHVGVRVESSRELAVQIGVDPDRVSAAGDWAVVMDVTDSDRRRAALELARVRRGDSPFWVVSFHRRSLFGNRVLYSDFARIVSGLAEQAEARGRRILFVPNMTAGRYSDDRLVAEEMLARCGASVASFVDVWRSQGNPRLVKAVLGMAEAVFTTRYHPLVFALDEGTGVIGLSHDAYYDAKLNGAAALFGLSGTTFRIGAAPPAATLVELAVSQVPLRSWMAEPERITAELVAFVQRHSAPGSNR